MEKLTLAVTIDRPVGFNHHGTIYPVNYGYVAEVIGGDGEAQDVYILTEDDKPLESFIGQLIAVVHRADDVETKWVVTDFGKSYIADDIMTRIAFMEQYFESTIEMVED
ncbi:inorganic pyrophosphatase [Pseudolactococcus chungangensis]|jgi:inorganic pyrophosphatase|uniref:Inorganic pyrophosphatase n=1 Tax=Pseudolactococcus chungangensis CAU 28 = DSM 22330 TaxID=1122154 RepID=A0A1K2HJ74_9LACT|nr:inorganic pyrophosphatase [Lactococcus chungangensis]MDD3016477.1 inorganic pyrophosphatase [Lactococcus chungangensis]NCB82373.1 inorganic pyrophosphatase [Bacilli bacterium]PCR99278.1 inorganic pyrophosphatase [Lactococcus chungangensis CAU 28 = DSM 22330]SFZ76900.1 inorganic pyrophosphatase [Lactococcus chungangensis CAU 28 = DSM 22330]